MLVNRAPSALRLGNPTLTFLGSVTESSHASSPFNMTFGKAAPGRRMFVAVGSLGNDGNNGRILTAAAIGGVSCTLHEVGGQGVLFGVAIASALVPDNSNQQVSLSFAGALEGDGLSFGLFEAHGLLNSTPTDSDKQDGGSYTLDTVEGGIAIAVAIAGGISSSDLTLTNNLSDVSGNMPTIISSAQGCRQKTGNAVSASVATRGCCISWR